MAIGPSPWVCGQTLGGYRLEVEIGRGAYGVVWMARRLVTGEAFAIKIVTVADGLSCEQMQRELEGVRKYSQICLRHARLLKILHVDWLKDPMGFYYVMELADALSHEGGEEDVAYQARTLWHTIRRVGPMPPCDVAQIGVQLCNSLEVLHQEGLAHRDIKPENILFVRGQIKLADFGLIEGPVGGEDVVGTQGYFPRERTGEIADDLYAVGKVLYVALTKKGPEHFPDLPPGWETIPDKESLLQLNEILHKACHPSAKRRYKNSGEMFEALQEVAKGPVHKLHRLRTRLRVSMAAMAVLSIVFGGMVFSNYALEKRNREERRKNAELHISSGNLLAAQRQNAQAMLHYLEALRTGGKGADWEDGVRRRIGFCLGETPKLAGYWAFPAAVDYLSSTTDGSRMLGILQDDSAVLVDLRTRIPKYQKLFQGESSLRGKISGDGRWVVLTQDMPGGKGKLLVYSVDSLRLVREEVLEDAHARVISFSGDNQLLAIGTREGAIHAFRLPSFVRLENPIRGSGRIYAAEFVPGTSELLCASWDPAGRIWDVQAGKAMFENTEHTSNVRCVRLSPDGQVVGSSGDDRSLQLRDRKTGRLIVAPLLHPAPVYEFAFAPDGESVITGCEDGGVRKWRMRDGVVTGTFGKHKNAVRKLAISADGKLLATAGNDAAIHVWSIVAGTEVTGPISQQGEPLICRFLDNASVLQTASFGGEVAMWDLRGIELGGVEQARRHYDQTRGLLNSVRRVVMDQLDDKTLRLLDFDSGKIVGGPYQLEAPVVQVRYDEKKHRLVVWTGNGTVHLLDAGGTNQTAWIQHSQSVHASAVGDLSADGVYCASGGEDGIVRVWNMRTGRKALPDLNLGHPVWSIVFGKAGKFVVATSERRASEATGLPPEAGVWDLRTGERKCSVRQSDQIIAVQFSPDEKLLLTGSRDHTAAVWDVESGRKLFPDLVHDFDVHLVGFSPDGKMLATASFDHSIKLWDAATGARIGTTLRHSGTVRAMEFSRDGRIIITGGDDCIARAWETRTGSPLTPPLLHRGGVTALGWDDNASTLYSSGRSDVLKHWRLPLVRDDFATLQRRAILMSSSRLQGEGDFESLKPGQSQRIWSEEQNRSAGPFQFNAAPIR